MSFDQNVRLDVAESAFFKRQLEFIDQTVYETQYPEFKARRLIPTQQSVPEWAKVYTYRLFDKVGNAKIVANMADDIPRADVTGSETSQVIKPITASYGWDVFEIKASAATGTPLDNLKAMAARFAIEAELDRVLMLGDASHNLTGLLGISNTTTYTPSTKLYGDTEWVNGNQRATPDEIADDIGGAIDAVRVALKNAGGPVFNRFVCVLPITQYSYIARTRMGDGSDTTILQFLLRNNPFLEAIEESHHSTAAGGGGSDRMTLYPRNPLVLAGVVPMEYTTQPPEQRNLEMVVNAMATTGGLVCRYPVAVCYADTI